MKLAIPVWEGRVSPVLDTARHLLVVGLEEGREVGREEVAVEEGEPPARAAAFARAGVGLVICGAVSTELRAALAGHGMDLISWTMGPVEEVIAAYLAGELDDPRYAMPGAAAPPAPPASPGRG